MSCNKTSMYSIGYTTGVWAQQFISNKNYSIPSLSSISSVLHSIVLRYKNLFEQDPYHVQFIIETLLIAFVIYIIIFIRKKDWKKDMTEVLSEAEKKEMIQEWTANQVPLGSKVSDQELRRISDENRIVIHQVKGSKIVVTDFSKIDKTTSMNNNTSASSSSSYSTTPGLASSNKVPTRTMLNMASHDFLGMGSNENVKKVSSEALKKYGCGACGPRGFYGTIDVHLDLEAEVAHFCNTEAAILYSDGASCVTSTVAAFSKRGDLLVVDEGIYEALQTGVTLSRSNVHFFKHNDMVRKRFIVSFYTLLLSIYFTFRVHC